MVFATLFSGVDDLIIIVVALVVIFGGSQLPKLAHNTGEALREFRRARSEPVTGTDQVAATLAAATPDAAGTVAAPPAHIGALPASVPPSAAPGQVSLPGTGYREDKTARQ